MKAILVRHGQTRLNLENTVFSRRDPPLDRKGLIQAHLVANELSKTLIDQVVTSTLQRAVQTARIIALDHDVQPVLEPDLMELNCGEAEGLTWKEVEGRLPGSYRAWKNHASSFLWPGGESLEQAATRVLGVFRRYATEYPDGTVVFVGHAMAFKGAIAVLLGMELDAFRRLSLDPGSITTVEIGEGPSRLISMNVVSRA